MAKVKRITSIKLDKKSPVYDIINSGKHHNFAINISEHRGVIVHNCALGDLMKIDFISRSTSVILEEDYFKVAINPGKYFSDDVREVTNNIDLITVPSRTVTVHEIVEFIKHKKKRYDVVVLDYDSNFKQPSDNMYESGGAIYDVLTEIARPEDETARLVFVAAQPKIHFWDHEKLPEEASGESSRKQQIIDMMITLGKAKDSNHNVGIMHIPKVRRGKVGGEVPYLLTEFGRIQELSKEEYAMRKKYGSK